MPQNALKTHYLIDKFSGNLLEYDKNYSPDKITNIYISAVIYIFISGFLDFFVVVFFLTFSGSVVWKKLQILYENSQNLIQVH
jgi:hypothetical protein